MTTSPHDWWDQCIQVGVTETKLQLNPNESVLRLACNHCEQAWIHAVTHLCGWHDNLWLSGPYLYDH